MQQEAAVLTMVEDIIWEIMQIMIQKNLVKPSFEKYKEMMDPNNPYCPYGNMSAITHGLEPIPDKTIGISSHVVISRIIRLSLGVHKTVPSALEWAHSGRSLSQDAAEGRLSQFLINMDTARDKANENILKDIGFMIRNDVQMYHSSAIAMWCPPKPYKIFYNQIHGGMLLLEQNIIKKNRANNPKTFHQSNTPAYKQYPKENLIDTAHALNLYNETGYTINQDVLRIIKEITLGGGRFTMKIPMQEIWDQLPKTRLVALNHNDDQFRYNLQCERRLRHEERCLWKNLINFISVAEWYGDQPLWFVHAMDYRGRIYPISAVLTYISSDPYRASFKFREGRKLGGKQADGYTGFEWLLIHAASISDKKKKATHEECLRYSYQNFNVIVDSGRDPLGGYRWWETCANPFQTIAVCIEIYEASKLDDPAEFVSHLPVAQDGTCNGFQHYSAIGRDPIGAQYVNVTPGPRPNDLYASIMNLADDLMKKEVEKEKDNFERLRIASLSRSIMERSLVKRPIMTLPYGLTRAGAVQMTIEKLNANVAHMDLKPVARYITRMIFQSVNETFGNAMQIRLWLTIYNMYLTRLGIQMEWITPIGLPVSQMAYKSKLNKTSSEEVLLAARDRNVLINQKANVYGAFPEVNSVRARNQIPPNFVHSIDASHAKLTHIYMAMKGHQNEQAGGESIIFNSIHDSFWVHPCNVAELNKQIRDGFVDIYTQMVSETPF